MTLIGVKNDISLAQGIFSQYFSLIYVHIWNIYINPWKIGLNITKIGLAKQNQTLFRSDGSSEHMTYQIYFIH
jgi:hypothetical protein